MAVSLADTIAHAAVDRRIADELQVLRLAACRRRTRRTAVRDRRVDVGEPRIARRSVPIARGAMMHRAWCWFLAAVIGVSILYGLLPVSLWKEPLYDAGVMACVVGALVGIRWHRPARGHPWWFFLGGMGCICAAEWIWLVNDVRGVSSFPSWGEYLDLVGRLVLLVGLAVLASRRGTVRDYTAVTDAVAVGVAACVVIWLTVFRGYFERGDLRHHRTGRHALLSRAGRRDRRRARAPARRIEGRRHVAAAVDAGRRRRCRRGLRLARARGPRLLLGRSPARRHLAHRLRVHRRGGAAHDDARRRHDEPDAPRRPTCCAR